MIKNLKRITAVILAIVMVLTSFTVVGFTASAAEIGGSESDFIPDNYGEYISNDELGELVSYNGYIAKAEYEKLRDGASVAAGYYNPYFEGCYDTGGNQIYVRRAMARQYVGEAALMIWVGGSRAYCIQPGEPLNSGSALEQTTNYGTWANLSRNQRKAINITLCYGREGNFSAIKGNTSINSDQCYIATQLIVWEIVNGERSAYAPYQLNGNGYLSMYCADGYNENIADAYHRIENAMASYQRIPTFTSSDEDTAPTYTLNAVYNNVEKKWNYETLTLTDTNGVLSSNFSAFNNKTVNVGNATVTAKMNGNTLTLTPSNAKLNTPATTATMSTDKTGVPTTNEGKILAYTSSYQDVVSGGSIDPPSAFFNVNVSVKQSAKLNSDFRVRKVIGTQAEIDTSDDDNIRGVVSTSDNLKGWYFKVSVSDSSTFYEQYHVRSFVIGPTNALGYTESISEYVLAHFDYSNVPYLVPTGYYTITELGRKPTEHSEPQMPDFYTPLRSSFEFLFSARENMSSVNKPFMNTAFYTNVFKIPLKIKKLTDDGSKTTGYYFKIVNKDTHEEYTVVTTEKGTRDASGFGSELTDIEYQMTDKTVLLTLPEGRYTLTELGKRHSGEYKIPDRFAKPEPVDFEVSPDTYKKALESGEEIITITVANHCEGTVKLHKTEEGSETPVEGAVYGLFSDAQCLNLMYQFPKTDADGIAVLAEKIPCNEQYYVKEIEAPSGYELSDTIYPVTIEAKEENEIIYELDVTDAPAPNPVEIRKTDITGTNEIEGAKLELRDSGGTLVEKWTSGKNAHVINDIDHGVYTLIEKTPADGFVTAEAITFTVQKGGEVTHVVMKDAPTKISIMKVDENNNPLSDAKLQILDSNGYTVVDTWTTDGNPYEVTGKLTVGKTYTLHEVKAPDGYLTADDVSFTVRDTSDVQSVKMIDQQTVSKFNKVDEQGNPVRGATLQLLKASGTKVAEWITDGTAKEIKGLTAGANYILRESKAPDGFVKAADVPFTVKADGSITTVTMTDQQTVSTFNKVDESGSAVKGATLQLFEASGTKVAEWITDGTAKEIRGLTAGAKYILRESKAPNGYTTAKEISFTVKTNGDVNAITMTDKQTEYKFSKVNEKGQRISGAKLQILDSSNAVVVPTWTSSATEDYTVKGKLIVGKKYKLHEVAAPNGYSLADDIEFEVKDSLNPITITMVDLVTGVYVSKVNSAGEMIENAHLQLTDSSGNVKADWYSTSLPKEIKGLTVGSSYTLTEITPPKGYVTSNPVTFTVKSGVTLVKMTDYPTLFFFAKREPGSEAFVSGAHLQVLDASGAVVEDWITDNGYHIVTGKFEIGKSYVLHEVEPPKGRALAEDIPFTVADTSGAQNIKMYDPKTTTYVSKFSITGQEELAGALLSVTDSHNNVIAEWTSTNRRKLIYGLAIGEEYTLTELIPAMGYTTAEAVKFKINDDGSTTTVVMRDAPTKVQIEKRDKLTNERIGGALLQLFNSQDEKIDEWTSSASEAHIITGKLIVGQTYRLHEEQAPNGYLLADDVEFTVEDTSKTQSVIMLDSSTETYVTKTDITGKKEVIGATLSLRTRRGTMLEEWVSDGTPHLIRYLVPGTMYILREEIPADGYVTAESVRFTVNTDGTPTMVEMRDAPTSIQIEKRDKQTHERISGALLQLFDSNGVKVDEWTSSASEAHTITGKLIVEETYTLHEAKAPNGYTSADDVTFTVQDTADTITVSMDDPPTETYITKTDITGKKEVIGATLTVTDISGKVVDKWVSTDSAHKISYLVQGAEYTLTETIPADGYVTAERVHFKVNTDGTPTMVEMRDAPTKIQIIKVDGEGKPLSGVQLQILDSSGKVVVPTWTTDGNPYEVTGKLIVGQTYKLHEVKPLTGYDLALDVPFTVRDTADVQPVTMVNTKSLGSLVIHKQDGDGNPLSGSEWEIFKADNTQLRFNANKDGSFSFSESGKRYSLASTSADLTAKELPVGDYYVIETKAPNGKTAYGKKIPFSIKADSEAALNIEITVKDNNVVMYNTGSSGNAPLYCAGALSLVLAIAAVLLLKRKKSYKVTKNADKGVF